MSGVAKSQKWNKSPNGTSQVLFKWVTGYSLLAQLICYLVSFFSRFHDSQKYLMLTQGRSGSTYLASLLSNHPEISCDVLLPKSPLFNYFRVISGRSKLLPGRIFIHRLLLSETTQYQDAHLEALVNRFSRNGWKIIHLYREDIVSQALSSLIAQQKNKESRKSRRRAKAPFVIDPDKFCEKVEEVIMWSSFENKLINGKDSVSVRYEAELMHKYAETSDRLQRYFNLKPIKLSSPLSRNILRDLTSEVSNWQELEKIVKAKGWPAPTMS